MSSLDPLSSYSNTLRKKLGSFQSRKLRAEKQVAAFEEKVERFLAFMDSFKSDELSSFDKRDQVNIGQDVREFARENQRNTNPPKVETPTVIREEGGVAIQYLNKETGEIAYREGELLRGSKPFIWED